MGLQFLQAGCWRQPFPFTLPSKQKHSLTGRTKLYCPTWNLRLKHMCKAANIVLKLVI